MAATAKLLPTCSFVSTPVSRQRLPNSAGPDTTRCLTCRFWQATQGLRSGESSDHQTKAGRKSRGLETRSVHKELDKSLQKEAMSRGALSRRVALVGSALVCASVVDGGVGVQKAEAASNEPAITRKVYFDITVDGEPIGRFVVGLYGDLAPIGVARFADLAMVKRNVGYRRRPIELITPTFIQSAALISLFPGGNRSAGTPITGGETTGALLKEMAEQSGRVTNSRHSVSLLLVDSKKEAAKQKLVAADGRFYIVEENSRPEPNGTAFAIATTDAPDMDKTHLVIGRILDGFDVVQKIAALSVNKDNSESGFFKVGKFIGDRRAIVAERGFNRPFAKVLVASCGEVGPQE